jgi:hypothetical protein
MKNLFAFLIIVSTVRLAAQPANDNCTNATNLTVNGSLLCGQNMASSSVQANECYLNYGGGTTPASVWYSFTASQSQQVLNFIYTNSPGCYPTVQVYGPFASVASGCSTAGVFGVPCGGAPAYNWTTNNNYQGAEAASYLLSNGDPGNHLLLTGLTVGSVYLIRIQDATGSTCGATLPNFCISVENPALNSSPPTASVVNACGVTFTGTTNGGYYNNGAENVAGFGNLDNCAGTTCPSCATAGDDVPYVINNVSWYTFCASSAGTWNVSFAVSNCVLPPPNNGAQIAVFTGAPCSWTQVWQSPTSCAALGSAQVPAGCSVTSSNFNVTAGQCCYMCVDGFAGDACDYSLVLTNVIGGCTVLPVELEGFTVRCEKGRLVFEWATATEKNSDYFTIEKSLDGKTFYPAASLKAAGNSTSAKKYVYSIKETSEELAYYRLSETAFNGTVKAFNVNAIKGCDAGQKFVSWASGDQINISVNSKTAGNYKVELYDLAGKLVLSADQSYSEGNSIAAIPVNTENGIYFLRIIGDENLNQKILIQK